MVIFCYANCSCIVHSISASAVLTGHLFSGRYKSLILDGSGSGYLKSVGDYVHLNPAQTKLVVADAPLKSFAWSSWPAYLLARSRRPAWLRVDWLLGEWGIPKDSPAGRQRLEQALEEQRGAHGDGGGAGGTHHRGGVEAGAVAGS